MDCGDGVARPVGASFLSQRGAAAAARDARAGDGWPSNLLSLLVFVNSYFSVSLTVRACRNRDG